MGHCDCPSWKKNGGFLGVFGLSELGFDDHSLDATLKLQKNLEM